MPITFHPVPDWTSFENQGGAVAAADLDGDGLPELVVLRVDRPTPGPNAGFYRVGRHLGADGAVAGWGPWVAVPDWGSAENQGAGLAVADLDGDGRPELIVFQVEHRVPGPNRGRFRIGRKLDTQGNVTGGWSAWHEVPDWVSWRDQGAAIAVGDIDGDGEPELVVFHIDDFHTDNPTRSNRGFYRVGFGLTTDGAVVRWGDWQEVSWFSWFNGGAGAALADLDGDGRPELVLYQVDRPPGATVGFSRVGWHLQADGRPRDGWSPWLRVEGSEAGDAAGGFTLAALPAEVRPRAVPFRLEDRPGENAGLFAVAPLALDLDTAAEKGVWRLLPYFSEVLPVHAALLHTGEVLFFAGSGNNFARFQSADLGSVPKRVYTSVVWNPESNAFAHPPTPHRPDGKASDFFCGGHCFLPDGRVLVAGGTEKYDKETPNGFHGSRDTLAFNPADGHWHAQPAMAHGRWYPTVVMLADGRAVAAAGLDENGNGNGKLEVRAAATGSNWQTGRAFDLPLYPHLFLAADDKLFFTGGKMDSEGDSIPFRFDPLNPTPAQTFGGLLEEGECNQAASVLLPPAQAQRFLILGGGPQDFGQATDRASVIDLTAAAPEYRPTASLNFGRLHVNAVLLPDRTVLAVGGAQTREASEGGGPISPQEVRERLVAERWDPSLDAAGRKWQLMAGASVPRLYHSVALLLPDGRVVSAGGNPDKGTQVPWLPPDPHEELRLEVYSPPYLFAQTPRPEIQQAPAAAAYGVAFDVRTPQAAAVTACLIRPGLTTHSFNGEQRLVDLPVAARAAGAVRLTTPASRAVAPPGWYMLFLTDGHGVPSVGRWIQLG